MGNVSSDANDWTGVVIEACIEVHRHIGPGFPESVYEEALCIELAERGIPFERQVPCPVNYKGHNVGHGKMDVVVAGCLVLELKTVDSLGRVHFAQVMSYLRASGHRLGLLINFNVPMLKDGIRRIVL